MLVVRLLARDKMESAGCEVILGKGACGLRWLGSAPGVSRMAADPRVLESRGYRMTVGVRRKLPRVQHTEV
jgi:hypothetical protein